MTDGKRGPTPRYSDAELLATIFLLAALGVRDGTGGGVAPEHAAVALDNSQSNLSDRMHALEQNDRLVKVQGTRRPAEPPETDKWALQPRRSFLPPSHPDAPTQADATTDGPPRTLREVEQ